MALNPLQTYVHLDADGVAKELPGGERFWSLPASELARYGEGWLFSEYEFAADWANWEMHPHADEIVYLLSGSIDLLLEQADGVHVLEIRGHGAVIIPRGIWHTAKVFAPSRMLHLTMGKGTQHRTSSLQA